MKKNKLLFIALFAGLFLSIADVQAAKKEDDEANTYELLNLFGEVMERAKLHYVEEVSDKILTESAIF